MYCTTPMDVLFCCHITVVSWVSAHSRVSAQVAVLPSRMESAHSRVSARIESRTKDLEDGDDETDEGAGEDDDVDDLDPFSDSDK